MQFTDNKAIYLQIAEYMEEKILTREWLPDERIPSVRDLAASLSVNYNTIIRTYEWLQQKEVIYDKRGLGYFVAPEAPQKLTEERRQEFVSALLPDVFKKMALLHFSITELNELYHKNVKK
jgi:DNA-binding transcriptional regulator YhcF (GntR family)